MSHLRFSRAYSLLRVACYTATVLLHAGAYATHESCDSNNGYECGNWDATLTTPHTSYPPLAPGFPAAGGFANLIVLKTGQALLMYSEPGLRGRLYTPNLVAGDSLDLGTPLCGLTHDTWCGGHAQLPDGTIAFVGGGGQAGDIKDISVFDPSAPKEILPQIQGWYDCYVDNPPCGENQTVAPCASKAASPAGFPDKWYPSAFTLATGKILVIGGTGGCAPVLYDHPDVWQLLDSAEYQRSVEGCAQTPEYPDLEVPNYPHLYVAPDGRLVFVGGNGASAEESWALEPERQIWSEVTCDPDPVGSRASVMYGNTIYKLGGADASGGMTDKHMYRLDLAEHDLKWEQVFDEPLHHGPTNEGENSVYYLIPLPDGTLLALGNTRTPELYDPVDGGPWRQLEDMVGLEGPTNGRSKHNAAALLPDARVIISGGHDPGSAHVSMSYEVFSPPYLFKSTGQRLTDLERPTLAPANDVIATGGLPVDINPHPRRGNAIDNVALIRLASVTHSVDFDTRYISLELNGDFITPPRSAEEAPPGYYMMFVVNDLGDPSYAAMTRVWGISQSSISHDNLDVSPGQFKIDIGWRTNTPSTGTGKTRVWFYPPSGAGALQGFCTLCNFTENGRHREGSYLISTTESGVWSYEVESDEDESGTQSRSYQTPATSFEVAFDGSAPVLHSIDVPINVTDNSEGVAWGDFDNDGDPDLFVANNLGKCWLLRNDGSADFFNANCFLPEQYVDVNGAAWADYDNDGNLDLFLARPTGTPNVLLRNEGEDPNIPGSWKFVDVAPTMGLDDLADSRAAAWSDFNGDGFVDIFVVNYDQNGTLYQNDGGASFTDMTPQGYVVGTDKANAAVWCDYDNDGDADLYVVKLGNGTAPWGANKLFRNDGMLPGIGDWIFVDVNDVGAAPLFDRGPGQAAAWVDYDNDGNQDVMLINNSGSDDRKLFRNLGSGSFQEVSLGPALDPSGRGVAWADYDSDGDWDALVTHDTVNELLVNNGSGGMTAVVDPELTGTGNSRGVAWADFNVDGDADVYIGNNAGTNALVRSIQPNNWLGVAPVGIVGEDASTIGCRIVCTIGTSSQLLEVDGGSGYRSQNYHVPRFGLADAQTVDFVSVLWPSGEKRTDSQVDANQVLTVNKWVINSSVTSTATQFCQNGSDLFKLDVSWQTTVTPDSVALEIYYPSQTCDGNSNTVVKEAASGTSHSLTFQAPCQPGDWHYTIKTITGSSVSEIACRRISGVSCPTCNECPPEGCQIE